MTKCRVNPLTAGFVMPCRSENHALHLYQSPQWVYYTALLLSLVCYQHQILYSVVGFVSTGRCAFYVPSISTQPVPLYECALID